MFVAVSLHFVPFVLCTSFFYIQFDFFVMPSQAKQSIKAVECAGINQSVLSSGLIVTKRILFGDR